MSDLTDNNFYPSAERIWLCIRLNNVGKVGLRLIYRRCRFWQKKIIFSDEAHFDLGGYVNKQNCRIWCIETRTLKSQRTQNGSLFGADFGPHNREIFLR